MKAHILFRCNGVSENNNIMENIRFDECWCFEGDFGVAELKKHYKINKNGEIHEINQNGELLD